MTTTDTTAVHHRILAGVDGSDPSLEALRWAGQQAALTGARLEVIMAWQWPTSFGWSVPFPSDYDPRLEADKLLHGMVDEARKANPQIQIEPRLLEGHPAVVLVESSAGADLLVVGSRGHGEFAGMLLGSVSEHCVAHSHCPVVVFRDER